MHSKKPIRTEAEWESAAAELQSLVYDQIERAAVQEPARSALDELRKACQFDIWGQPNDSPESGRLIKLPTFHRPQWREGFASAMHCERMNL